MERPSELAAPADRVVARRPALLTPALAVVSLMAGALPSFSPSAYLMILSLGGVLFWLGVSSTAPQVTPVRRLPRAATWWMVPLGLLAGVEAVTFLLGSSDGYPTLSRLADPILERYPARSALFFGWVAAFWGMVRR